MFTVGIPKWEVSCTLEDSRREVERASRNGFAPGIQNLNFSGIPLGTHVEKSFTGALETFLESKKGHSSATWGFHSKRNRGPGEANIGF